MGLGVELPWHRHPGRGLVLLDDGARRYRYEYDYDEMIPAVDWKEVARALTHAARPKQRKEDFPSITCPRCGWTSYNPGDIEHRYCGHCNNFHDQMSLDVV